jgi:nucleotide-binding universal stress UspA family protein
VTERVHIRRILVALDASRQSLAALEAATRLASELEAELLGMFVEDVNLLRLAGLPFAREIGHSTARARRLADVDMLRALRAQAARAEQALAGAARGHNLRWSFRVARGQVAAELLHAAQESDLLALGVTYISVVPGARFGTTLRAVMAAAPRPLLLLPAGARLGPPYVLVYDGSDAAQRALALAASIAAGSTPALLRVLLVAPPDRAERLRQDAGERLDGAGIAVTFGDVAGTDPVSLARALRACAPGVVVLPAGQSLLADAGCERLLESLRCAALVVR